MSILQIIKNVLALILKGGDALKEWKERKQRAKEIDHAARSAIAESKLDELLSEDDDRPGAGEGDDKRK